MKRMKMKRNGPIGMVMDGMGHGVLMKWIKSHDPNLEEDMEASAAVVSVWLYLSTSIVERNQMQDKNKISHYNSPIFHGLQ